ncbi:MAG: VIT1/CCC1 transporter family protein [Bryobacterales bacterium]
MPATPHVEKHFTGSEMVRDIVIGMSDGLTVPFALAAGLSGAAVGTGIVVTAGLAEVAAGSIAMGLGGYLAARTDVEHYFSERQVEETEVDEKTSREVTEVADIFRSFGMKEDAVQAATESICADRQRWVDFMMRFELGLEKPDPSRAARSAATIAFSYVLGGLAPLSPYFFVDKVEDGLLLSVAITSIALLLFGYVKGRFTARTPWRSAFQTLFVGAVAASAAFGLARWLG